MVFFFLFVSVFCHSFSLNIVVGIPNQMITIKMKTVYTYSPIQIGIGMMSIVTGNVDTSVKWIEQVRKCVNVSVVRSNHSMLGSMLGSTNLTVNY